MVKQHWRTKPMVTRASLKFRFMAVLFLFTALVLFVHYRTCILCEKRLEASHSISTLNESGLVVTNPGTSAKISNATSIENRSQPTNVLYIAVNGRLGNRIFELASAIAIARKNNRRLVAHIDFKNMEDIFPNLNTTFGRIPSYAKMIRERGIGKFTNWMYNLSADFKHIHIVRNFQSFKYFQDYEDDIRRRFVFNPSLLEVARETLENVSLKSAMISQSALDVYQKSTGSTLERRPRDVTFIGIHVRHGDFARAAYQAIGYALPKKSYYLKAMNYYRSRYANCLFVVASEVRAVTERLGLFEGGEVSSGNVTFLDDAPAHVHLAILSKCNHTIISSGSFSWWAGYLTGGTVIYFIGWPAPKTELDSYFQKDDYYPSNWIPMDN